MGWLLLNDVLPLLLSLGGVTPTLSPDLSIGQVFGWMAGNFSKLPTFVGKVRDFAALSCATNFAKTLTKAGCGHVEELKRKKDYEGPASLGGASKALMITVRHFMEHFWCKFGRQDARAKARRAEVCALGFSFCLYF